MIFALVLLTWVLIFAFVTKVLRDGTHDKVIAERMAYREKNNREAVEAIARKLPTVHQMKEFVDTVEAVEAIDKIVESEE